MRQHAARRAFAHPLGKLGQPAGAIFAQQDGLTVVDRGLIVPPRDAIGLLIDEDKDRHGADHA
uniref:hypothetical protein n=1 Tax=Sphingomonas bacterium TaxID=1895847 RepID=UPI002601B302|nr:hypothetical protein [Sphingomonas bacterium]